MMIKKLKEFIVRLILNDPDFNIPDNNKSSVSKDKTKENNKEKSKEISSEDNKPTDNNEKKSDSSSEKQSAKRKSKIGINIYLSIAVVLSFCFYLVSNHLVDVNNSRNIEYNAYFSEIDMTEQSTESPFPININTASAEEIMLLPDIGSTISKRIVKYRTENNGFNSIEEIMNIQGIGEGTFEKIKDLITL